MLTMSFVYFNNWQIKQTEPRDFATRVKIARDGNRQLA
jgi:hypothetical protein